MSEASVNRLHNSTNPYQGSYKKVLCVCSAGLLRSPTAAWLLSQPPYNFNTRAVGVSVEYALIPICVVTMNWCDEIVVMDENQRDRVVDMFHDKVLHFKNKKFVVLDVEDRYPYRSPELLALIKKRYDERSGWVPDEINGSSVVEVIEE